MNNGNKKRKEIKNQAKFVMQMQNPNFLAHCSEHWTIFTAPSSSKVGLTLKEHMFGGRSGKSNFIFLSLCRFHICVNLSFPSPHYQLISPIRADPCHRFTWQEQHQCTGDSGGRGRRLIKRDLMTGINLDFRGQVGLADAQQPAGLREKNV